MKTKFGPKHAPVDSRMIKKNMDTAQRVMNTLARLNSKGIVLAFIPSSKKGKPPYPIVLGENNAIRCKCNGFLYRSRCRHMDRFRNEIKPVNFK